MNMIKLDLDCLASDYVGPLNSIVSSPERCNGTIDYRLLTFISTLKEKTTNETKAFFRSLNNTVTKETIIFLTSVV
jgi:hypothetical protein